MPLLIVAFFVYGNICFSDSHLIINEVQITGGSGKTKNDFIEIYNPTSEKINLNDYRLVKRTKTGTADTSIKSWASDTYILGSDYYLWANSSDDFVTNLKADTSTSETISDDNGIAIIKKDSNEIIDSVGWGKCQNAFVEKLPFLQNPGANQSIERNNFNDSGDNSIDFAISNSPTPTPSQKVEEPPKDEPSAYLGKVYINEIYPAPDTKDAIYSQEFVEITNESGKAIDFSKWKVTDSKNTSPKVDKNELKNNFYVFYGTFSFNNDKDGDTAVLYDEKGKEVDRRKYEATKSKKSYAFDSSAWKWTNYPTPGDQNKFDKVISGKISMDDTIYAGIYANFSVKAAEEAEKFTWDFGDGHKSYLQNTRHIYEEDGKYSASLKITGEKCEDKFYEFTVEVKNYAAPKVRIVSINPNPKGNDMDNEWIELENQSKKKVDLEGWSIATGTKKLYNHPIREKFEIKPGKAKKLTQEICAFTLNNEKNKIELRDPAGKVVDKIKYNRQDNKISEDEIYKENNDSWEWSASKEAEKTKEMKESDIKPPSSAPKPEEEKISVSEPPQLNPDLIGKYSFDPAWQNKKENQVKLLGLSSKIKIPENINSEDSIVLGAATVKNVKNNENYYSFTKPIYQKHWAEELLENIWMKINYSLNLLINKI